MTDILDLVHAFSLPLKAAWFVWLACGAALLFWRIRRAGAAMAITDGTEADGCPDAKSFEEPAAVASEAGATAVNASHQQASIVDTATPEPAMPLAEVPEPRFANVPPPIAEANDIDSPAVDISQFQIGAFESYAVGDGRRSKRAEKRRRRARARGAGGDSGAGKAGGVSGVGGVFGRWGRRVSGARVGRLIA